MYVFLVFVVIVFLYILNRKRGVVVKSVNNNLSAAGLKLIFEKSFITFFFYKEISFTNFFRFQNHQFQCQIQCLISLVFMMMHRLRQLQQTTKPNNIPIFQALVRIKNQQQKMLPPKV